MIEYVRYMHFILFIVGLVSAMFLGPVLIPLLKRLKFGQTIREDGPQSHLTKSGTPTIGGLIFLAPVIVFGIITAFLFPRIIPALIATIAFGAVGFTDDWIKVVKKSKDGFKIKQKTIVILAFSIAYAIYIGWFTDIGTMVKIPFWGMVDLGCFMGFPFILFIVVYMYGTINSVNFADGLDGLLTGLMVIVMVTLGIIDFWLYGSGAVNSYALLIVGSLMGFLLYNIHPAKVFMGDTGSLALGGALASMLLIMRMPFMVFMFGAVFVIEGLSVALQVFSFKTFGKRIFKMAPIHHHFEILGWKETKVVKVFWIFCYITCVAGCAMLMNW